MRILTILTSIALLTALPASAAPGIEALLAANKIASGGSAWDRPATLKSEAHYVGQGLSGPTVSVTDLDSGHYADSFDLGAIKGANGFDGKDAWAKDPSGTVTVQAGGDQRQIAVNEAYRRSNGWWRHGFEGAAITALGTKTEAGKTYQGLRVTPEGGKAFEAWFDATSHLLARTVERQGAQTVTISFSDYRAFDGLMLPVKTVTDTGSGAQYVQTVTLTTAELLPKQADAAFGPPKPDLGSYTIAGGAKEARFAIDIINNHIFGKVMVNGKGPFNFIFDTGGNNIVVPATAHKLELKIEGRLPGQGVGDKVAEVGITRLDTVGLGAVTFSKQPFYVLDFAGEGTEGVPMDGMIGFEVFRRFVTRIDYAKGSMTLIEPSAFDPKTAGTPVPFEMDGNIPQIKGSFEGITGLFDIDTGARTELTLTAPFVAKEKLRARHPKGVEAVDGWGVGGPAWGYVTRGGELALGTVKIPGVVTSMSVQDKGAFASDAYQGNIGGGVLKRFEVTFDYEHRILYLKPASLPVTDVGTFDRSGMWVNAVPDGLKIMDVTRTGPAQKAGLKTGDIITAIDGKAAASLPVYMVRKAWRNDPAGTVVRLTIGAGKTARHVPLVLEDQI